jgi:diguanylate cyclase (GGDEF)-like protein
VLVAALLIGACIAAACWAGERAYLSSRRASRLDDVRATLRNARGLIAARQQTAAGEASRLAARRDVQEAFVGRDATALVALSNSRPRVGFVLWDGRSVGAAAGGGPTVGVTVYDQARYAGRVLVSVAPDSALLDSARRRAPATHLFFTVGGRVLASSPQVGERSIAESLAHNVSDELSIGTDAAVPARLYAYRAEPSVPLPWLWPFAAFLLAGTGSYAFFGRREARRRAEPPPNTVRDAVALVGETLAATHNVDALLPVILRAAVEVTEASGGRIVAADAILASRGAIPPGATESLEITLDVSQERSAIMTLFPPPVGFGPDARDAAAWIAAQALIALENARLHGQVQRQAVTDELTGLANRRRFLSQLDAEITRSRRSALPLGIVLADLDDFKRVNDTYGHDVGDLALRAFADILQATVRDVDLPVRLGGEEFAVLLPDTDLEGAAQLAERLREALDSTRVESASDRIHLTASFGVSCFPSAAAADDLLTDADRRLYDAKRRGKNTVVASKPVGTIPL